VPMISLKKRDGSGGRYGKQLQQVQCAPN